MKFLRLPTKRIQIDQKGVPQLLTENWKATRPLIKQQAIQARQAIQKQAINNQAITIQMRLLK